MNFFIIFIITFSGGLWKLALHYNVATSLQVVVFQANRRGERINVKSIISSSQHESDFSNKHNTKIFSALLISREVQYIAFH